MSLITTICKLSLNVNLVNPTTEGRKDSTSALDASSPASNVKDSRRRHNLSILTRSFDTGAEICLKLEQFFKIVSTSQLAFFNNKSFTLICLQANHRKYRLELCDT